MPLPTLIITGESIEISGLSRLNEIIQEQTGLITVPDFGGGEGIQMQGLDASYVMILIDGQPLFGRIAGTLDLSRISVNNIERIEIVKGASSSLYGSEALAGVVNIITNTPKNTEKLKGNLNYKRATFNMHDVSTTFEYGKKKVAVELFGNYFKTNGTGSLIKNIANSDSFTFTVGLANYNPVTIINKTGTADQFSVYVFDEVYEFGTKGNGSAMTNKARIQSTWEIGKTSGNANAGNGVDFVFEWESSKRKGGTISNPSLNHYNRNTNEWEFATNSSISRGKNSLRLIGSKGSFSPFAIGDGATPLPVDLVSFDATPKNNTVDLTWTTYSDNTNPFNILKSTDGINWSPIGILHPTDNTIHYLFTDHKPAPINYYQLSQLDNSNTLQYSDIRVVNFNSNTLSVFPNPNNGEFTIQSKHVVQFQISDYTGKVIMEGDNTNSLIKTNFAKGIYFIKITEGDKTTFSKMIVQ